MNIIVIMSLVIHYWMVLKFHFIDSNCSSCSACLCIKGESGPTVLSKLPKNRKTRLDTNLEKTSLPVKMTQTTALLQVSLLLLLSLSWKPVSANPYPGIPKVLT